MKYKFLLCACMCASIAMAQTNKTFFLGHSLVNFNMPNMVNKLSIAGSKAFSYNANIGNGANLLYHWNNPTTGQGSQWNTTLPQGGFEHLIITEAVPLLGHLQWSNTYKIADSLYQFASLHNPNIKYYLYETWHCNTTGTPTGCEWDNDDALMWRPRLTADLPKWEAIADSVNANHPNAMLIIPAGQALARLNDSIDANKVPGITTINQLFSDDIHLTNIGNYFVACVMYGVIHKESPVGLPNQLTDEWGTPYAVYPTISQANMLQKIAWETLCSYTRDGVTCNLVSSINSNINTINPITVNTNSYNHKISVNASETINNIDVYTLKGELIYSKKSIQSLTSEIELPQIQGMVIIKIATNNTNTIKKIIVE